MTNYSFSIDYLILFLKINFQNALKSSLTASFQTLSRASACFWGVCENAEI